MKIKNNPNQRQENIIQYLNEHGEVTTEEIKNRFNVAKSTLSEDIKFLRSKGYPIITRYGYISLEKQEDNSAITYYEKFSPSIIRKWLILYAINIFFHSESEPPNLPSLYEKCDLLYSTVCQSKKSLSKQVFHKDINELIKDKYLDYTDDTKESLSQDKFLKYRERELFPTEKAPKVLVLDQPTAYALFYFLENELATTMFSDLKNRLLKHWPNIKPTLAYSNENFYTTPIPDMLENFMELPYKTNCVDITYQPAKEEKNILYKDFETYTIIYTIKENNFYILGSDTSEEGDEKNYFLIPVENIVKLQASSKRNTIYKKYYGYADEVLQTSLNINQEKPKLKKRYEAAFEAEYKENINECFS